MKCRFLSVLLAGVLISTLAKSPGRPAYYPLDSKTDYRERLHVLRKFVHRYGKSRVHRIYVAKADPGDGKTYLYGYWREGHSILILTHFTPTFDGGKETTDYGWLEYKARIDLHTDVVPSAEDVGGSTFLVDKPWADRIVKTCVTDGRKIVIHRTDRVPSPCHRVPASK